MLSKLYEFSNSIDLFDFHLKFENVNMLKASNRSRRYNQVRSMLLQGKIAIVLVEKDLRLTLKNQKTQNLKVFDFFAAVQLNC